LWPATENVAEALLAVIDVSERAGRGGLHRRPPLAAARASMAFRSALRNQSPLRRPKRRNVLPVALKPYRWMLSHWAVSYPTHSESFGGEGGARNLGGEGLQEGKIENSRVNCLRLLLSDFPSLPLSNSLLSCPSGPKGRSGIQNLKNPLDLSYYHRVYLHRVFHRVS